MRIEVPAITVILAAAAAACVGTIGDGDSDGKNGGTNGDAESEHGPLMQPSSPNLTAAPAHARRLSTTEIRQSMRDLFALDEAAVPALPSEAAPGQFDNRFSAMPVTATFAGALQSAAEAVATAAVAKLSTLVPCAAGVNPSAEASCAGEFVDAYGLRVYRRPLTAEERAGLMGVYDKTRATEDFPTSIATVIEAMLQSPGFLFRVELGAGAGKVAPLTPYEVASALSYFLWQSTPDQPLLDAAAAHKLNAQADVEAQAKRMLADPRTTSASRAMFLQWLTLADTSVLQKTDAAFSPAVATSMRAEVATFVEKTVWGGAHGFRDLFTSSSTFVDGNLASLYGLPAPKGSGLSPVTLDPSQRAGLLTMPGFIASHTPGRDRAPIRLGHFVRSALFCQVLPAAPPGIPPAPSDPNLDVRARYAQHEKDPTCQTCHRMMDPIGFGWSRFDVMGRFSPVDHGVTQDGRGELNVTDIDGPFVGPVELGRKLATSASVQSCFVGTVLKWALGREAAVNDPKSGDVQAVALAKAANFAEGDLKDLFVKLATSDSFLFRDTTNVPQEGAKP